MYILLLLTLMLIEKSTGSQIVLGNPWDTPSNASVADEDELQFAVKLVGPTTVFLRQADWSVGPSFGSASYTRNNMEGIGAFWTVNAGVGGVWIDMRPGAFSAQDLLTAGAVVNGNMLTYNLTYVNQHDGLDIVHNHGQLGDYIYDGVPLLSALPIQSGETVTYMYNIDLTTNSGTYFIHSHWGMNSVQGMSAPLIIQYNVPSTHPLAAQLNDPDIHEVLMYLEDWCLVYTNADDATTSSGTTQIPRIMDASICQNPMLAYRAVWGEWNSLKKEIFLNETDPEIDTCEDPVFAMEFGFTYFMANDKTFDDPQLVQVTPNTNVRLRVINAGRMTNFRLQIPVNLNAKSVIVAVDGHYIVPTSLGQVWISAAQRVDLLINIPEAPGVFPILAYTEGPAPNTTLAPEYEFSNVVGIILYSTSTQPVYSLPYSVPGIGMLSQLKDVLIHQESLFHAWPAGLSWTPNQATKNFEIDLTGYNGIMSINKVSYQLPPIIPLDNYVRNPNAMRISAGDKVCVTLKNYAWDVHPIHLHGHMFQVVAINGVPFSGAMRDTVSVPAGQCNSVKLCFDAVAQNGGVHPLHCHMAVHEMSGMFTTFEYDNYVPISINGLTAGNNVGITSSILSGGGMFGLGLAVGLIVNIIVGATYFYGRRFFLVFRGNKHSGPHDRLFHATTTVPTPSHKTIGV